MQMMAFGAALIVGFALLLLGAYRRCDGMGVLCLFCGWAGVVVGIAGLIAGISAGVVVGVAGLIAGIAAGVVVGIAGLIAGIPAGR
jgi:hypothetical protein